MAVTPATGRNPAEREQILASQNLLPTEYMAPNYLVYGNAPGFGENGMVGLYPGKQYTLYDNRTNSVLASGSTPEEIKRILSIINTELVPQGNKADWRLLDMGGSPAGQTLDMHTRLPSGFGEAIKVGDQYGIPIAGDVPNSFFKEYILPTAGILAATAGAYFGGNALLGAAGGGAGGASSGLIPGALEGLSFAPVGTAAVPASTVAGLVSAAAVPAVAAAGSDLVITALIAKGFTAAEAAALVASGGAAAALANTANAANTAGSTTASNATNTMPPAETFGPDLTLTANMPTNLVPASLLDAGAAAAAAAANAAGSTTNAADLANSRTGMTDAELAATNAGAGGTSFLDKIISNMGIMDYATLASLVGSAVAGGGGGGGAGPTTPYVSPLGAGTDFAGLASRRQINPNIADYERYGFGPEAQFFSGIQTVNSYTPPAANVASPSAATGGGGGTIPPTPAATTPAATTPAAPTTTTNLLDSVASTGGNRTVTLPQGPVSGGSPTVFQQGTPVQISPTARETNVINNATAVINPANRVQNLGQQGVFDYYKNALETAGAYARSGYITPEAAALYTAKLNAAMAAPNASLEAIRAAAPMPQYTYTAPSQPITDRGAYINDLYKQIGANVSQGLLAAPQAQTLQGQLRQAYLNPQSTTEQLQGIYNTGMQQYKPLI
jgi:hypothetical protein